MELITNSFWNEKSVFITGHTGFKGSWLSLFLATRGAKVHGFSLPAPTEPSFFETCGIKEHLASHSIGDIRDQKALRQALNSAKPEIIFHLAAQPLVRESYCNPVFTIETNVIGLMNLLESTRSLNQVRAIVNVTTDKCYENRESDTPFKEDAPLGGFDCYSASKACSEIITSAYRRSFLREQGVNIASARAGNVIGGGDWSENRLLPDFFRAIVNKQVLQIRYPNSIRPWQHVLEVLNGYTMLGERLLIDGPSFAEAWNFGPTLKDCKSVGWIIEFLCSKSLGIAWCIDQSMNPHEARVLKLDSTKARERLNWRPVWSLETALDQTVDWYNAYKEGEDMFNVSLNQINLFLQSV